MSGSVRTALRAHPILQGVDARVIDTIAARVAPRSFVQGEIILREGEPARAVWLLCRGSVRVLYRASAGLEVTVKLLRAPAMFGELQVLHGYPHTEECQALEPCVTVPLPKPLFLMLLEEDRHLLKNVLLDVTARFLIAAQHERALAFLPVPSRLAHLLLSYVRLYGVPAEGGTLIRLRLSQEQLAQGLGVARKSVVRTVSAWIAEGILKKRGAHYLVTDLTRLQEQAPTDLLGVDWVAGRALARSTDEG